MKLSDLTETQATTLVWIEGTGRSMGAMWRTTDVLIRKLMATWSPRRKWRVTAKGKAYVKLWRQKHPHYARARELRRAVHGEPGESS